MGTYESVIIESMFMVADKQGQDVEFKLNLAQRAIDEALTGRDLVPKARQEGVSTYVLARFLAACLMYRNTRAVIISHEMESTQRLLARVHYMIEHIRGPKPIINNMSKNEITFPKTNSMFYIGTAGSKKFGRGDTITHLHCSEYAFWPNAKTLMSGLLQAVPMSGEVIVESTGNGYNDYYRRCMRAEQGRSVWALHFLAWHTFPEYTLELKPEEEEVMRNHLNEEWDEPRLLAQGLTLGQLAWRRMKLDEMDYDLTSFQREYPMTLDECFHTSSESVFHHVIFEPTDRWVRVDRGLWALQDNPRKGLHYVMGADVSAGVGKDSSVAEIFCLDTQEQVCEYMTDRIDPEEFGHKLAELGRKYNKCYTVVEQNNHGILTLATLNKLYPKGRIHRTQGKANTEENQLFKLGFRTTLRTKPLMIGGLRTVLAHEWTIHSSVLKAQLSTFVEEDGKLGAQQGCDDDAVIAAACAAAGRIKAAMRQPAKTPSRTVDPLLFDAIVDELTGNRGDFPIAPQHSEWN